MAKRVGIWPDNFRVSTKEKSYDELMAVAQAHWSKVQALREQRLNDLHDELSKMPDVANAPKKDEPWNDCKIRCFDCDKETMFHVERWVTVNGQRHRAELQCLDCKKIGTYDFVDSIWLTCGS